MMNGNTLEKRHKSQTKKCALLSAQLTHKFNNSFFIAKVVTSLSTSDSSHLCYLYAHFGKKKYMKTVAEFLPINAPKVFLQE